MISPQQAHLKPLPMPDADSAPLWKGLKEGKLLLQHCQDCQHIQYYHQAICRECLGENLLEKEASGKGSVYSYSVVYRAPGPAFKDDTPYAVVLIELEEGPRMISSMVDVAVEDVGFDMKVEMVVEPINDEISLPRFRPVSR